jgi:hypothetical protein
MFPCTTAIIPDFNVRRTLVSQGEIFKCFCCTCVHENRVKVNRMAKKNEIKVLFWIEGVHSWVTSRFINFLAQRYAGEFLLTRFFWGFYDCRAKTSSRGEVKRRNIQRRPWPLLFHFFFGSLTWKRKQENLPTSGNGSRRCCLFLFFLRTHTKLIACVGSF